MKKFLEILGWVLLLVGVLGFIPGIAPNGMLLGIFMINPLHNIVHILTGVLSVYFARQSDSAASKFAYAFAAVYALVALLGLTTNSVLGLIPINSADNVLHVALTLIYAYIGYSLAKSNMVLE